MRHLHTRICAAIGTLLILGCSGSRHPIPNPGDVPPLPLGAIPIPALPERGPSTALDDGSQVYTISLGDPADLTLAPGHHGTIWVYLPPGTHDPGSLPAVLIAPAGSTLMSGMALADGDRPEHLPYLQAGFAVVAFDLDGQTANQELDQFWAALGGTVNARNALVYARSRVPEINASRIFIAGHSSAGDVAQLFAAQEPTLAGAVSYNAAGLGCWFQPPALLNAMSVDAPHLWEFCTHTSARAHANRHTAPLFVFGSDGDLVTSAKDVRDFAQLATEQGASVTLKIVPTGDHYSSMISQGIPAAIAWMKAREPVSPAP